MEDRAGLLPGNLESRDEGWERQVLCPSPWRPCPAIQHPSPSVPLPHLPDHLVLNVGGGGQ